MEQKSKSHGAFQSVVIFAVYSNIWISIGAALWTLSTHWILNLDFSYDSAVFVGFATLFTYNFQRLIKLNTQQRKISLRNTWISEHKSTITFLSTTGAAGTLITLFFLPIAIFWLMIPLGIISLGYAVEFLPATERKLNLRSIAGLKIILISLTWAVSTVFVPILESNAELAAPHFILVLERFLFVVAITIPFDIRDLKYDEKLMRTLPQVMGIRKALWVAVALLTGCFALDYLLVHFSVIGIPELLALLGSYFLAGWLITLTTTARPELYFTGALDGLFVTQSILLFLAEYLV